MKFTVFALFLASASLPLLAGTQPINPVPEPSTYVMMGAGVAGLAVFQWRKSRKK